LPQEHVLRRVALGLAERLGLDGRTAVRFEQLGV
jgi:hypothetical protein